MSELHDLHYIGNLGIKRTIGPVKKGFFWPTLEKDLTECVKICDECQKYKQSNQKIQGILQHLEVCTHRWEQVSMNLMNHFFERLKNFMILCSSLWTIRQK